MVAKTNTIKAETRSGKGSSAARRLRGKGVLPGVVYGGKGESQCIQMNRHDFEGMLRHERSENVLIDLVLGESQPKKVLLKEVQHHPLTGTIAHVDLVEVSMTEVMRVRIPVVLVGDPVGVTQEGGILEQVTRELEVECLPGDLVEMIEVDVSGLKLAHSIKVGELVVSDKLKVLTPMENSVALVSEPRKEEEEVKPEGEAAAGAEPEVITKKKEDGEEGEAEAEGGAKGEKKEEKGAAKGDKKEEKGAAKGDKKEEKKK